MKRILNFLKRFLGNQELPQSWTKEKEYIDPKDALFESIFGAADMAGKPSKDWRMYMPQYEPQAFGDCVSFSRTSTAETKSIIQGIETDENEQFNFSDLDLAVGSGTTQQGNSLRTVAEYARKTGISLEKDCPYTTNWNERVIRFSLAKTKKKYKLGSWSWVATDVNTLKNALEDGPLQIGIGIVANWNSGGILRDTGQYSTYHAIVLTHIDAEGNKYIFDSYQPNEKILDKNYKIYYAMSFKDLPNSWRFINAEMETIMARINGKIIIRADIANGGHGETYRVTNNILTKITFNISDAILFDTITKYLALNKVFIGVTEEMFKKISERIFSVGGKIEEAKENLSIVASIKDLL